MGQSTYIRDGFVSAGNAQVTGSLGVTGGITGSLLGTATSATLAADSDRLGGVAAASYALNSAFTSFATTGSNTFVGNQTITGSITITQNLTVLGSSSIQYITSSQLNIANNLISVNTNNPGVRFGEVRPFAFPFPQGYKPRKRRSYPSRYWHRDSELRSQC